MLASGMATLFERYPGLSVELMVHDTIADLFEERLDVALQAGQPSDTSYVARLVGTFGWIPVAAPEYLERYGAPANPSELAGRPCIIHDTGSDSAVWRFSGPDGLIKVAVSGVFRANNGGAVHRAALAGYGIALLWEQRVADDIRAARLHPLLTDYPSERSQVYVIYPSRQYLAPRTRVVIDFLIAQVRLAGMQMEAEPEHRGNRAFRNDCRRARSFRTDNWRNFHTLSLRRKGSCVNSWAMPSRLSCGSYQ